MATKQRGARVTVTCVCGCCKTFEARTADVKRGWGKYFNKSHKAIAQEARTGQHAAFKTRAGNGLRAPYEADYEGGGWDAHKDSF